MPQMMPINWIISFILFIFIFILFNIMNYYIYNTNKTNSKIFINKKLSYNQFNWKW